MPSVASLRSYLASNNVGTLPPQHCEYALDTTKRASALLTAPECRPGRGNAAHGASRWSTVSGIREADGHLAPPMFTANPPRSGATDFRNVVWEAGHLHLHLRADDSASREHAAALQYMLPNEALASNTKEPPVHTPDVLRVVATPATCSVWRNASVFFFRPSNPSLWHIYAEYILPIVNTMYADGGSGPERRLYVIPNNDVLSNKHWAHFFAAIGGVGVAADLFDSSRKCFNHLTWGIGMLVEATSARRAAGPLLRCFAVRVMPARRREELLRRPHARPTAQRGRHANAHARRGAACEAAAREATAASACLHLARQLGPPAHRERR